MQQSRSNQNGNVFILILIGVILFGALGYTFSRSANKGAGNLTKQQVKIAAQEIINYAHLIEGAVDRVRRNGCSETEISFDNTVINGYSNINTPIDGSCSIFSDNGGKISWKNFSNSNFYQMIEDIHCISGFGTGCPQGGELVYYIGLKSTNIFPQAKELCIEINTQLNTAKAKQDPPTENYSFNYTPGFQGTYSSASGSTGYLSGTGFSNETTACGMDVVGSLSNHYIFYHILLIR